MKIPEYEVKWGAEVLWGAFIAALVFLVSAFGGTPDNPSVHMPDSGAAVLAAFAGAGRVALGFVFMKLAARVPKLDDDKE